MDATPAADVNISTAEADPPAKPSQHVRLTQMRNQEQCVTIASDSRHFNVLVPVVLKDIVRVVKAVPQEENVQRQTDEHFNVLVPVILKDTVEVVGQLGPTRTRATTDRWVFHGSASFFRYEKAVEERVPQQTDDRFADVLVPQSWNKLFEVGGEHHKNTCNHRTTSFVVDVPGPHFLKEAMEVRLVSQIMGSWTFSSV